METKKQGLTVCCKSSHILDNGKRSKGEELLLFKDNRPLMLKIENIVSRIPHNSVYDKSRNCTQMAWERENDKFINKKGKETLIISCGDVMRSLGGMYLEKGKHDCYISRAVEYAPEIFLEYLEIDLSVLDVKNLKAASISKEGIGSLYFGKIVSLETLQKQYISKATEIEDVWKILFGDRTSFKLNQRIRLLHNSAEGPVVEPPTMNVVWYYTTSVFREGDSNKTFAELRDTGKISKCPQPESTILEFETEEIEGIPRDKMKPFHISRGIDLNLSGRDGIMQQGITQQGIDKQEEKISLIKPVARGINIKGNKEMFSSVEESIKEGMLPKYFTQTMHLSSDQLPEGDQQKIKAIKEIISELVDRSQKRIDFLIKEIEILQNNSNGIHIEIPATTIVSPIDVKNKWGFPIYVSTVLKQMLDLMEDEGFECIPWLATDDRQMSETQDPEFLMKLVLSMKKVDAVNVLVNDIASFYGRSIELKEFHRQYKRICVFYDNMILPYLTRSD